jgi:hypothetical protein
MVLTPRGIRVGPGVPFSEPPSPAARAPDPDAGARRAPSGPDFVVTTGASLEGADQAVVAIEALIRRSAARGDPPIAVEVRTPYPAAFFELIDRFPGVTVRHSAGGHEIAEGCSFVVRRGPGAAGSQAGAGGGQDERTGISDSPTDPHEVDLGSISLILRRPGPWFFAPPGADPSRPAGPMPVQPPPAPALPPPRPSAMLPVPSWTPPAPAPSWTPPADASSWSPPSASGMPPRSSSPSGWAGPPSEAWTPPARQASWSPPATELASDGPRTIRLDSRPYVPPAQRLPISRRRFLSLAIGAVCAAPVIVGGAVALAGRLGSGANVSPPPIPIDKRPVTLGDIAARPLMEDAWQRRAARLRDDPGAARRVNDVLSRGRYSVAVFGWGEEHGETYAELGGSISVLSFDVATGAIDTISLSRDIRTPEIERALKVSGSSPQVLRRVYRAGVDSGVGGFQLMRAAVESITGLQIDHQVLFKDIFVKDFLDLLIEKSGRKLSINVEKEHTLAAFRLGGVDFPAGTRIDAGRQEMSSVEAMRYILAEDANPQGRQDERSYRKMALFRAVLAQLQPLLQRDLSNVANPMATTLLDDFRVFLDQQGRFGHLVFEHDAVRDLLLDLFSRGYWARRMLWRGYENLSTLRSLDEIKSDTVRANRQIVIHDPYFGDGGVRRVHNIRNQPQPWDNPGIVAEVTSGMLKDPTISWMLIPDGGDPYASDLVTGYWAATRSLVRRTLMPG